jgi:hypothetical protein
MVSIDLLQSWRQWASGDPPYLLDLDRPHFDRPRSQSAIAPFRDWRSAYTDSSFEAPGDTKVHLSLVPKPFCGDVANATIYLLLLNPGLGPWDYYGEMEVAEYRQACWRI